MNWYASFLPSRVIVGEGAREGAESWVSCRSCKHLDICIYNIHFVARMLVWKSVCVSMIARSITNQVTFFSSKGNLTHKMSTKFHPKLTCVSGGLGWKWQGRFRWVTLDVKSRGWLWAKTSAMGKNLTHAKSSTLGSIDRKHSCWIRWTHEIRSLCYQDGWLVGGFKSFFMFNPIYPIWGTFPFWRAYFSTGLGSTTN